METFYYSFFFQGDIRFEIYSLWLLLLLRSYHARITYKLANQSELTETEDDFVFIYCIKQPWVASSIFVAPSAKIGIWIILRKFGFKSENVQNWLKYTFMVKVLPQFCIQLVYKPHFGTYILLFGSFGQSEKKWIWVSLSIFLWAKKQLNYFFKYWRVHTKNLHKIKYFFF